MEIDLKALEFVVIYHEGCRDGFTAAWVARKALTGHVQFVPGRYGEPPPPVAGKHVVILDFSYSREILERMHAESESILLLDHHETAEKALKGLEFAHFDMCRSGARMAWDHWFGGEPPWLVAYVEDRDLWRFALPDSKEINAVIGAAPMTFDGWDELAERGESDLGALISEGRALLRSEAAMVERIVAHAVEWEVNGVRVALVNTPVLVSEVLSELAKRNDFAMSWFQMPDGTRAFSLRSERGRGAHVGKIAEAMGGGGHRHAAGFKVSRHDHTLPRTIAQRACYEWSVRGRDA